AQNSIYAPFGTIEELKDILVVSDHFFGIGILLVAFVIMRRHIFSIGWEIGRERHGIVIEDTFIFSSWVKRNMWCLVCQCYHKLFPLRHLVQKFKGFVCKNFCFMARYCNKRRIIVLILRVPIFFVARLTIVIIARHRKLLKIILPNETNIISGIMHDLRQ